MCDFDHLLTLHGEWVAHGLSDIFETARRQSDKMRDEVRHKDSLVAGLEAKIRKIGQEQEENREKERMITTECEGLREKIRCREDEKLESHNREERMQRQC